MVDLRLIATGIINGVYQRWRVHGQIFHLPTVCPELTHALATFTRFVSCYTNRRTFSDHSFSVTATLADPNGVCGENRRWGGLSRKSIDLNPQSSATKNVYRGQPMACRYQQTLTEVLRKNERGIFVSSLGFHTSKESQQFTVYCFRIVHKVGGFATSVDVPTFAHGLIFVVDVVHDSP